MKKTLFALCIGALALSSCGGSKDSKEGDKPADPAAAATTTTAAAASVFPSTNEADWEVKDLSTMDPTVPVSLKAPKTAKLRKLMDGVVDVDISDDYRFSVSTSVYDLAKAVEDKKGDVKDTIFWISAKMVVNDPDGFVYTMTQHNESDGTKHKPESHFYYFVKGGKTAFVIKDERKLVSDTPDESYSEDIAKKVYAIVKSSAKHN